MRFSISNRALLRSILAGAVVLAGTTACSRSDRDESGRDNAAVFPDTVGSDTAGTAATGTGTGTETGAATSDTASTAAQPTTPRARTAPPDEAAGYRSMEQDTATMPREPGDTARATDDSASGSPSPASPDTVSETSSNPDIGSGEMAGATPADTAAEVSGEVSADVGATDTSDVVATDTSSVEMAGATAGTADEEPVTAEADTAVAGYTEMARDTSTTAEQADTVPPAEGDVAVQAEIDTTHADAEVSARAEVTPPVDSTEVYGQVTTDENVEDANVTDEDREAVAAAETPTDTEVKADDEARPDEVGAAAIGGNVTGADALAGMTRQGAQCIVLDPETAQGAMWDMSSTPATLNPCGLGSMILSRIWTAGSGLRE